MSVKLRAGRSGSNRNAIHRTHINTFSANYNIIYSANRVFTPDAQEEVQPKYKMLLQPDSGNVASQFKIWNVGILESWDPNSMVWGKSLHHSSLSSSPRFALVLFAGIRRPAHDAKLVLAIELLVVYFI